LIPSSSFTSSLLLRHIPETFTYSLRASLAAAGTIQQDPNGLHCCQLLGTPTCSFIAGLVPHFGNDTRNKNVIDIA
jgi:hypothetical protein